MRLKSLTLNGYKTFASKAQFEFGNGITCIIGPNGSGKSNIADGIRWALGEQQFSLLRGKRTDDMIFSGSVKRPRASMAEVILTFDNSDGFFPIEFNEIEIGRRAFRDGANEYILNSNRVRLRDVSDLLGHSGLAERTYTVIGQGLVDNALAQKPEERRALFEEAAGIAAYRDRREDALRKLDETRHNLERAQDILNEITPRLKTLERQTERARQYQVLKAELDSLTRQFFGYHYRRSLKSISDGAAARDAAQASAAAALAAVNAYDSEADSLRQRRVAARAQLSQMLPRRDAARSAHENALRGVAVIHERLSAAENQLARAQLEVEEQAAAIASVLARSNEATMLMATSRAAHLSRQIELEQAQSATSTDREAKEALERQRDASRQRLIDVSAGIVGAQKQSEALRLRQDTLRDQISSLSKRTELISNQRDAEIARREQLNGSIDADARQTNLFDAQFDDAAAELQRASALVSAAQAAFAAAEAEERLTSRFSFFADMRAQQSADDLAQALMGANIEQVRGTLNAFIQVLPEDQKAVEAALGDLLHAVIVAPEDDADDTASLNRVRAWLTEQGNGRLTIIPSRLRAVEDERLKQDAALAEHARSRGARPLLDSIQTSDALKPVLQLIAGGAFIARDLHTARELAVELVDGCVVVTRDGEAAYPVGTLSLPAGARSPVILGAESEAAAFEAAETARILDPETARKGREQAQLAFEAAQREHAAAKAANDNALRARDVFARETITRKNTLDEAARRIDKLEESLAALAGEIGQLEAEVEGIDAQVAGLMLDLERRQESQLEAQRDVQEIEAKLTAVMAGGWFEAVNSAQNALAMSAAALKSGEQVTFERVTAQRAALKQRDSRQARVIDLRAHLGNLNGESAALAAAAGAAEAEWKASEAALAPVQQDIAEIEQRLNEHDAGKRDSERALRDCQTRVNALELEFARHNDALEAMRARAAEMIAEEDGAESRVLSAEQPSPAMNSADTSLSTQQSAPGAVDTFLASLPEVETLADGLDDRINQLRGQIKRLGAINFEAQAEYDDLKKRHDFITEQSSDLTQASDQLRQVIGELNDTIKVTFRQTFDAINEAFQNTFKVLFGGGQAKLTLINPDNIDECGVEILAQPPGKRAQSLALLSGGERSLTATALLFAILQVRPTPFCVLDEVDAALDESNVGRFRSMVESLSDSTQFIIITHNRRTVEAANTIYGISMSADGASTALSLKLDEVKETE